MSDSTNTSTPKPLRQEHFHADVERQGLALGSARERSRQDAQGGCTDVEGFQAVDNAQAWAIMRQAAADIIGEEVSSEFSPVSFHLCLDDASGFRIATIPISASFGPSIARSGGVLSPPDEQQRGDDCSGPDADSYTLRPDERRSFGLPRSLHIPRLLVGRFGNGSRMQRIG